MPIIEVPLLKQELEQKLRVEYVNALGMRLRSAGWPLTAVGQEYERRMGMFVHAVPIGYYLEKAERLASQMWEDAGCPSEGTLDFWMAAEKHIATIACRTVVTADTIADATKKLTEVFETFAAGVYLEGIREAAYFIWEASERTSGHALEDWLEAEARALNGAEPSVYFDAGWAGRTSDSAARKEPPALAQPYVSANDTETANAQLTPTEWNTPIAVTITIDKNYATYTIGEANHLIARLSTLLELPKPARILNIEEGCVKITIEITIERAHKLLFLQKSGMLDMLGIEDVVMIGDAAAAAIVARKRADGTYDVFMCHNADDKREVIRIGVKLRSRGILPWLDEWELRPGALWQKELESQICNIKSVAVFVGESGMGPWQNMEVDAFIRRFTQRQCPIIPAILRSCKNDPVIPLFLNGMTWVDFRKKNPDPYERLVWGITGENSLALSMR